MQHPVVKAEFDSGEGIPFTAIGYPMAGTASKIEYPEGQPIEIVTQSAQIVGRLGKGTGPDRYMLNDVSWDGDLNGFSGSPVIVNFKGTDGQNCYALAGMLVSAGPSQVQFIRISVVTVAVTI